MAPIASMQRPVIVGPNPSSPTKMGWTERRAEIPSILVGRGQENASTIRHNLEEGMDSQRRSSERARYRGRQNSLKRAKDSTDILRQKSLRTENVYAGADANPATKEGRQFTVANVGNHGKIYLRPITRNPPQPQVQPSAYSHTDLENTSDTDIESSNKAKRWSDTQGSKTPTRMRSTSPFGRGAERSSSVVRRSVDSMSTIGGGNAPQNGRYKVTITHADAKRREPEEQILPTLEVPIPHYRLGTPRFSTRGTAFLHSQVYSGASATDDVEPSAVSGSELDVLFPVPPGMEAHTALPDGQSHAAVQPPPSPTVPGNAAARIPITSTSPVYHRAREPIVPAIYDAIAANPDDPSIVRYAMSTREISAASPARLIAQITSKNFLDYELLSDFFLTVRTYLSTHDLLAYLLTRFEWAINRFDDDGRVIRVRAFAAIRHWILNYFPYDFVMDRDLRVKFCQYLNDLARQVRQRPSHEPSDSKLIVDLKKCWNGRCALFWDSPMGGNGGRNDLEISPGGIMGSRDSHLTNPGQLWHKMEESSSQQIDQAKSVAALRNWVDSVIEAEVEGKAHPERGNSIVTSRSMVLSSHLSEQSIQAFSCSIPGKPPNASATGQGSRNVGPHPIPTAIRPAVRRICPAASSAQMNEKPNRSKYEHKRSGSFSNALQDKRTSLPSMQADQQQEHVVMSFPFSGSLIRGSVVPPASPFMDNMAAHGSATSLHKPGAFNEGLDHRVTMRPMSPGVKNLLGTIRRAIGSKQSSSTPTPTLLSTAPFMVETKNSMLPMHIAYKMEVFGDQHHQLEALKKNSRIDLLCADITDMFERALSPDNRPMTAPVSSIGMTLANEREQLSTDHRLLNSSPGPEREALQRTHSEMTNGSQSIVIVDGTAMEPPVPLLPPQYLRPGDDERPESMRPRASLDIATPRLPITDTRLTPVQSSNNETMSEGETPHSVLLPSLPTHQPPLSQVESQLASASKNISHGLPSHRTRPSMATGQSNISYRSSRSGPRSLRKYASYQSGMRRSGPDYGMGATSLSESSPISSKGDFEKPAGRMLRRRPGGDLRANQNVHEMESIPRPRSTGSITTYTDSMRSSAVYLKRITARDHQDDRPALPQPAAVEPIPAATEERVSLVSTRPSQPDLRKSFEAAVAEFARIPDDDGGDLEATMLKLEGKFRKSPIGSSEGRPPVHPSSDHSAQAQRDATPKPLVSEQQDAQIVNAVSDHPGTLPRSLYANSENSYHSVPLLERGLESEAQPPSEQSNVSLSQALTEDEQPDGSSTVAGDEDLIHERRGRYRSSMPTCTTDSFLLDEDEFLSDLSSELSEDLEEHSEALDLAYHSSAYLFNGGSLPPNVGYAQGYLPSPPMTTEHAIALTSETNWIQDQRKPPTPEPSPVSRMTETGKSRTPEEVDGAVLQPFANTLHKFPTRRHIPFILAYDAKILAQQFTIIERDALNEINWQDLIDMRWQSSRTEALNWVEYLRFQRESSGIELVTARFNIVVKWTLSEIVLTQNSEERALAIIKYIQIAQAARRYHNYATMLQLTIALTSVDVKRLTKSWDKVPAAEKASLKEMEKLISPLRNFHHLRAEIEAADIDNGCIPVVALYIHDLTYNAQKPSIIASTRDSEPLINFERYRTSATIVKGLLRLIDASAKYDFRPANGALERCLWMASLSDDMIRTKSKEIEPEVH